MEENKNLLAAILTILLVIIVTSAFWYRMFLPMIVESRQNDLNMLKYDSTKDEMIGRDYILSNSAEIYYLQHGTMNGYNE